MKRNRLLILGLLILGIAISCTKNSSNCIVFERHANGVVSGVICDNVDHNIKTVYLFNENSDTVSIGKVKFINDELIPIKYVYYENNQIDRILYYDQTDTNRILTHYFNDSKQNRKIEYVIGDTAFYYNNLADKHSASFAINYRMKYINSKKDSILQLHLQVPIPDSIIQDHQPLYFMYGAVNVSDTVDWLDQSLDIYADMNKRDSIKVTSSKKYQINYPLQKVKETHIITALYNPKEKSVHSIKKKKIKD